MAPRQPAVEVAVVVEGINIAKRHTKPRPTGSSTDRMPKVQQGGILDIAQPLPISKVMVVCAQLRPADPGQARRRSTTASASGSAGTAASGWR